MRIYVASKARYWPFWTALRAAGLDIRAPWLDWAGNRNGSEPTVDDWAQHWSGCVTSAADADVTLFYAEAGATQCGALVELGAALAAGKQVFVVSPYEWTVAHHPRCRTFQTLEAAVTALVAMAAGERARRC